MPSKPYRHKIYRVTFEDIFDEKSLRPLRQPTDKESRALLMATIEGLLARLERRYPRDFIPAKEGMKLAYRYFGAWVDSEGLPYAKRTATFFAAEWSSSDLARGRKPSPLLLFSESVEIAKIVDKVKNESVLRKWLLKHEKMSCSTVDDVLAYWDPNGKNRPSLIENILGKRHKMGESAIHKDLARATKQIKARQLRNKTS